MELAMERPEKVIHNEFTCYTLFFEEEEDGVSIHAVRIVQKH
jgi:hypothetical protein